LTGYLLEIITLIFVIAIHNPRFKTIMNNIPTYQSGSTENPAIVFLHGSPLTGRMWTPQMEHCPLFSAWPPIYPDTAKARASHQQAFQLRIGLRLAAVFLIIVFLARECAALLPVE
jgi:hypothetical protein